MNDMMCRVLYAKYNTTRSPEYRVITEICEGVDGIFVRKRANGDPARAHLKQIHENSINLRQYYRRIDVVVSTCGDSELRFPFIKGRTLAERVCDAPCIKEEFVARVNEKLDTVFDVPQSHRVPFALTGEFEAMFGKVEMEGADALQPANIDSLLSNFLENESGLFCIDYEWVCYFPVPLDFLKYRVLRYLYMDQAQSLFSGISMEDMLGWFGFTEEQCKTYWQMEYVFQQHIHGAEGKYIYTSRYRKKTLPAAEMDRVIHTQDGLIRDKDVHIQNLEVHMQNMKANIQALEDVVSARDVHIHNLEQAVNAKEAAIHNLEQAVNAKEAAIQNLQQQVFDKERHIQNLGEIIQQVTLAYNTINAAFFWRITKPARVMLDSIKRFTSKNESVYLFLMSTKNTLRHGHKYAVDRKREYLDAKRIQEEKLWPTDDKLLRQRNESFPQDITFSILVPLYNTPEDFLRQMIQSVQAQSYEKWELCLADGSDQEHRSVKTICQEAARKDKRIRYRKLERNGGISENTNACIGMASGDYIALFDHDDILHPSALYENMKVICAEGADFIYSDEDTFHETPADAYCPHYKPDYSPDTLRSYNYICHFTVFKRTLLDEVGGCFRREFDGSQDYDMILRLTEKARRIVHIPRILYYWRGHSGSVASDIAAKSYTIDAAKKALADHLSRVGLKGEVLDSTIPSTYKMRYVIDETPLISIVIPNMDHVDDLKKCIDSISEKSTWKNWEIIIVENNSKNDETFTYYRSLEDRPEIRIVTWEGPFNFSAICNFGVRAARGEHILLLNNDIQVITPDWLEQMLMFAQRPDVGAVGAMLYYPDNTIQHAGVIVGLGGVAGHSHKYFPRGERGYSYRLTIAQNLSAVTAACCMIPRRVWEQVNGLDESFEVAFNDVDLCLRIRAAGYLIVWTPYAELYHFESKSRGLEDTPEKQKRFGGEIERFKNRWDELLRKGDPYYNPHLTLDREDFSLR